MDSDRTLSTFLDFYRERGHQLLTGTSLLPPPGDPVLFTTAGMHPLTPYLRGREHPLGRRLVNVQRCLRTTDLGEVGDPTHLTVFEMLGSWSLGDYSGPQSLTWGYELLRDGFGLDPGRLKVTVFGGDGPVGPDTESMETWDRVGVPIEVTTTENWWDNGPTGPCGPDSEIFYWTGDRWVEIWNHVMMRYERHEDGSLTPLVQPGVDTGMGFERLLAVLQDRPSVYDCDIFEPWVRTIDGLWGLGLHDRRIVVDHLRSSSVVVGDGVNPSTTGRGYVLRRLVRRLLTTLWRDEPGRTLDDLPDEPFAHTREHFRQAVDVRPVLRDEERRFRKLLTRGRPLVMRHLERGPLTDDDYRYLHDTHGLPRELVDDLGRCAKLGA